MLFRVISTCYMVSVGAERSEAKRSEAKRALDEMKHLFAVLLLMNSSDCSWYACISVLSHDVLFNLLP